MPSTVPDKYRELQESFPGLYLFDATGELNDYGKLAQELLVKRNLLKDATFVLDDKKEFSIVEW